MKAPGLRIEGHWHHSGSAARVPAILLVSGAASSDDDHDRAPLGIEAADGTLLLQSHLSVAVSDRVGTVARTITFADGSVFTTKDNDAVDIAFQDQNRSAHWVHSLESSKRWILCALIGTVLFTVTFFRWGIPWASLHIAHALPERVGQIISSSSLDFLDDWLFEETTLDAETTSRIEAHFRSKLLPLDDRNDGIRYRLLFRKWTMDDEEIANALALPSGDIVLTDAFVRLCESQQEMDSVILHEIGHIVERHSLQRMIEGSFVATTVMLVTGDGSGFSDFGVGLGSLLVGSHYSRNHETAADRYAFDRMLQARIDPVAFGTIMTRMSTSMTVKRQDESDTEAAHVDDPDRQEDGQREEPRGLLDYFSSHPNSNNRIEQANRYSECFNRGETHCDIK